VAGARDEVGPAERSVTAVDPGVVGASVLVGATVLVGAAVLAGGAVVVGSNVI
jgi:hypothetical protein